MLSIIRKLLLLGLSLMLGVVVDGGYSKDNPTLTKEPFLLAPQGNSIVIRWETDRAVDAFIQYGLPGKSMRHVKAGLRGIKNNSYLYQVSLGSLLPGQVYRYQVEIGGVRSKVYSFQLCAMEAKNCDFIAFGDSRSQPEVFRKALSLASKMKPEFAISMGDLVADGGGAAQWQQFYFQPAESLIARIPLISTLGDHEGEGDNGELFRHFLLSDQAVDAQWFSFDWGPAHFVSLDYRYPDDPRMIEWFKRDMQECKSTWKFVYMHRPCYNLGGHRSFWGACDWPKLFRDYKVDIVFAGHSHQFERFYPTRPAADPASWPVTYITTGGAGASLYDVTRHSFLAATASEYHIVAAQIRLDTLRLKALRLDGSVIDSFEMIKYGSSYNDAYLALVVPQERLNLVNAFAQALTFSMADLPQIYRPHKQILTIHACPSLEKVCYTLALTKESSESYQMAAVMDTMGFTQGDTAHVQIYARNDITVSGWGDVKPVLRLEAVITSPFGEDRIAGGQVEYWAGKE